MPEYIRPEWINRAPEKFRGVFDEHVKWRSGDGGSRAYLTRANLAGAYLAGADLAGADLAGAYLARADLAGANLADANLADANLAGADLAGADLARANLARANLADAKSDPASPEEIKRLDEVREIGLKKPERLYMGDWHSGGWTPEHTPEEEHECGSAHCIAGWLQALCPDEKIRRGKTAAQAGELLAPTQKHMFYTSDAVALQWLKDRGYARSAEAKSS